MSARQSDEADDFLPLQPGLRYEGLVGVINPLVKGIEENKHERRLKATKGVMEFFLFAILFR